MAGMGSGAFADTAAALIRLQACLVAERHVNIALELSGANAVAADDEPWGNAGFAYLERQVTSIGGGTSEMARAISLSVCSGCLGKSHMTRTWHFATSRKGRAGNDR